MVMARVAIGRVYLPNKGVMSNSVFDIVTCSLMIMGAMGISCFDVVDFQD
jgi:hypothetical protein